MTVRRITKPVVRAVRENTPLKGEEFGVLRPGDIFQCTGRTGKYRFLSVRLNDDGSVRYVNASGPVGNARANQKSIDPSTVKMPGVRAINNQRRRRAEG